MNITCCTYTHNGESRISFNKEELLIMIDTLGDGSDDVRLLLERLLTLLNEH